MPRNPENILVWLPSPLGDAVMSTPALRALRQRFAQSRITLYGNAMVRAVLSPSPFGDAWLAPAGRHLWAQVRQLRAGHFDRVILCKNSLGSALICWLARIPVRVGYAREGRGWLLTDGRRPLRRPDGSFCPAPMIDYYLALCHPEGVENVEEANRRMELSVDPDAVMRLQGKLPSLQTGSGPLVVLVPGGGFGPSKCWPAERFAQLASALHESHGARVVLSVAPNATEQAIAAAIVNHGSAPLINLAEQTLDLGELKALYTGADLVITNDTGPRHIALALQRNVVTLFGPNDPAWTQTGCKHEIQIIGRAPCAPCQQPTCHAERHLCMESITVSKVLQAAHAQLEQ